MLKIKNFALILLVFFTFNLKAVFANYKEEKKIILTISSGAFGNTYREVALILCPILEQNIPEIKCIIRTTQGSLENASMVSNDNVTIGIAESTTIADLSNLDNFKVIATPFNETIFIVSTQAANLMEFNNLPLLQKINIGSKNSGTNFIAKKILNFRGWDKENLMEVDRYNTGSLMCRNEIEASFFVSFNPSPFIASLVSNCKLKINSMEEDFMERFIKQDKSFTKTIISAGFYEGQNEEIHTLAVESILFVSKDFPEDLAYKIAKVLYYMPKNGTLKDLKIKRGVVSLHTGVEKFLKEVEGNSPQIK